MILFASKEFASTLNLPKIMDFFDVRCLEATWSTALARIQDGESFIFIGTNNLEYLKELWIDSDEGCLTEYSVLNPTPAGFKKASFSVGNARFLHIRPQSTYAMHGIDEEPRAEIIPLVTSHSKYGDTLGYPGLLVKNYACSLTGSHYKGGFWFIFAIATPNIALSADEWNKILATASVYSQEQIYIARFSSEFALYHPGERIRLEYAVENRSDELSVFTVEFAVTASNGQTTHIIGRQAGSVTAHDCWHGHYDWYPSEVEGYVSLKAVLKKQNRMDYGLERENNYIIIDEADAGVFLKTGKECYPKVQAENTYITIDGEKSFFTGTHLYASSDFFELSYRHIRMPELKRTIEAIKRAGIRICRIWCDPILDEESLRGMNAYLELLAQNGIVAVFTLFTSWTHTMETNLADSHLKFEVASMKDDCLLGLYLHNISEQKEFSAILGKQFAAMSHIIWDFSNEFSVLDPTEDHLNEDWLDHNFRKLESPYQNINLFEQWALQIHDALKTVGVVSPVVFGVSCWNIGSENYRCTKKGDIVADHSYYELEQCGLYSYLQNTACINKPFYMEEFGGTWTSDSQRADEMEGRCHYFLGAGHSAAVNYEWGVSWLCDQLPGLPPYMKFVENIPLEEAQTFLYEGRYIYAKSWPLGSIGLCPWTASFDYGSSFNCVDSFSKAVIRMRRIADFGKHLAYTPKPKDIYLVLPFEVETFRAHGGYNRKTAKICTTIQALWQRGIPFQIWQEDELDCLPKAAKLILYPHENEITDHTRSMLDSLRSRGTEVFCGEPETWIDHPFVRALSTECAGYRVFYRDTPLGTLTLIAANEAQNITLNSVTFGITRFGAFIDNGGLVFAEFTGDLLYNNILLMSSSCQCLVRSASNIPFTIANKIFLYPYSCGKIRLHLPFKRANIVNDNNEVVDSFSLEYEGDTAVINVTQDVLPYSIQIQ